MPARCSHLPATAQDYPTKPIRIIVPFGPGGGGDIVGRIFGQALQEKLGQPVVIENKPGAAGTIGNELVARAEKDGYTIGMMTAGQIIAGAMNKSLRYDTATAFEPISQVGDRKPDDRRACGLSGQQRQGADRRREGQSRQDQRREPRLRRDAAHVGRAVQADRRASTCCRCSSAPRPRRSRRVLGKQVDVLFDTVLAVIGQVQSGQLKAIAVTSKDRFPIVPECAGDCESAAMPGYDVSTWYGLFGPRGMPPEVVAKLNKALNEALKDEAVREKLIKAGVAVQGSTPEEFGKFMPAELARWNKVREAAGIAQQ